MQERRGLEKPTRYVYNLGHLLDDERYPVNCWTGHVDGDGLPVVIENLHRPTDTFTRTLELGNRVHQALGAEQVSRMFQEFPPALVGLDLDPKDSVSGSIWDPSGRPDCLVCGGPVFEEYGEWFHYGVPGAEVTHDVEVPTELLS